MPRPRIILVLAFIAIVLALPRIPRASGPLNQQAYVWQRSWSAPVIQSVADHAGQTSGLVALAAEVAWERGKPQVARVGINYPSLSGHPLGLAIRIGPNSGRFDAASTTLICNLARDILAVARAAGCQPSELQLDFDAATSKLAGYRVWVEAIKAAAAPTPISITALPAWLSSRDFEPLAKAAGSFILQVHSLTRPSLNGLSQPLCDTSSAKRWVERAARIGIPFRVALPTYTYLAAYDDTRKLLGILAESDAPESVQAATIQEVRSDPDALAHLVRTWTNDRPACMTGLIWYRLPNTQDRLNWPWPTLASVMQGIAPAARITLSQRQTEPGLIELFATNNGAADSLLPTSISVTWSHQDLIAADALAGLDSARTSPTSLKLSRPSSSDRLRPGEERQLAWMRFPHSTQVTLDASPP